MSSKNNFLLKTTVIIEYLELFCHCTSLFIILSSMEISPSDALPCNRRGHYVIRLLLCNASSFFSRWLIVPRVVLGACKLMFTLYQVVSSQQGFQSDDLIVFSCWILGFVKTLLIIYQNEIEFVFFIGIFVFWKFENKR